MNPYSRMFYGSRVLFVALTLILLTSPLSYAHAPLSSANTSGKGSNSPSNLLGLDLSSTKSSVTAGNSLFGRANSATININGVANVVQAGSQLTPAEYVALLQVLSSGTQSLNLGAQGNATSGSLSLSLVGTSHFSSLVIPANVRVTTNPLSLSLTVSGVLQDQGSLIGLSPLVNVKAGTIVVSTGGSITTGQSQSPTDLSLRSLSDLANSGTISASGVLSIDALGSISNTGSLSGINGVNLFATTGQFTNSGQISSGAGSVNFNTLPTSDLMVANTAGQILANQAINFRDQLFNANSATTVSGGLLSAQAINFAGGKGAVNALVDQINGAVNVNACTANVNVSQGTLTLGTMNVSGDPTIVNSDGDVALSGNLKFSGNLAIIAAGQVTESFSAQALKSLTIDVSSSTGNGGNVTIVSGYNISPDSHGQNNNDPQPYTIDGTLSGDFSSVVLFNVSIKTSSSNANGNGGNVAVIAAGPFANINVNSITTSSTAQNAGSVTLIATNGVFMSQSVTASGGKGGGTVLISSSTPQLNGGSMVVTDGTVSGGTFGTTALTDGSRGFVGMGGIITSGKAGVAGNVTVEAPQQADIEGPITATGGANASQGFNGGNVQLTSLDSAAHVKGSVSMTGGTAKTLGGSAGSGGQFTINAYDPVLIEGSILANGGANSGNAGAGGIVSIATGTFGTGGGAPSIGSVTITGSVDLQGGKSTAGTGGAGGSFTVSAQTLQVEGKASPGSSSINTAFGTGTNAVNTAGTVSITTYGTQPVPTDFNLTNTVADTIALPGGLFNVGNSTVNGAAGAIVNGSAIASPSNAANITDANPFSSNGITLTVVGSSATLVGPTNPNITASSVILGKTVRNLVTPGEALALYQESRNSTQDINLNSSGQVTDASATTINGAELPKVFSQFNLATAGTNDVTLTLTGAVSNLTMPKTIIANFMGTITNADDNSTINVFLNGEPLNVGANGGVTDTGNGGSIFMLVTATTKTPWSNLGTVAAQSITLQSTGSITLNMGASGVLGQTSGNATVNFNAFTSKSLINISGGTVDSTLSANASGGNVTINTLFDPNGGIGTIGTGASGAVSITSTGNIQSSAFEPLTVVGKSVLISTTGSGTIDLGGNAQSSITAFAGSVSINSQSGAITLAASLTVTAGSLKANAPAGVLPASSVAQVGAINIIGSQSGSSVSIGQNCNLSSNGADATVSAQDGGVTMGDGATVAASGGNVLIVSTGTISGGTGDTLTARSIGTSKSFTGGGVQISSGTTTNAIAAMLASRPPVFTQLPDAGTISGAGITVNSTGTRGVVQLSTLGGGTAVFNNNATNSTFNVSNGVVLIQSVGAGAQVTFDNATIGVTAPVNTIEELRSESLIDTGDADDSDF